MLSLFGLILVKIPLIKGENMNKYLVISLLTVCVINSFCAEKSQKRTSNSRRTSAGPSEKDKILSALSKTGPVSIPNKRTSGGKSPRTNPSSNCSSKAPSRTGSQAVSPYFPEINSPGTYFGMCNLANERFGIENSDR